MELNTDFNSWVSWVFDHPVTDPAWHSDLDAPQMDLAPSTLSEYVTLLFENPRQHLDRLSNDQLGEGFWFLVPNQLQVWFDQAVPWPSRKSGIAATETLFRELFARRGSPDFTPDSDSSTLDAAGYMWWDIIATSRDRTESELQRFQAQGTDVLVRMLHPYSYDPLGECIDVMGRILLIDSPVCRYSALHGLGHWQGYDQKRAVKAIDAFLANATVCDQALLQYARDAREGNVQ